MPTRKAPTTLLDIALDGLRLNSETQKDIDDGIETAIRRHIEGELTLRQVRTAMQFYDRHHRTTEAKRRYYLDLIQLALEDERIDISAPELMELLNRGEKLINREEKLIHDREQDPDWELNATGTGCEEGNEPERDA